MRAPESFEPRARSLARAVVRPDGREAACLDEAAAQTLAREFGLPLREAQALALDMGLTPERYLRNRDGLDPAGQARLLRSLAVVCGLGGLGGYVLETLCRMGVGRIRAADGDAFEASNLNRQLLADGNTLGRSKAEAALARAQLANPAVELAAETAFWDREAMAAALRGADVAVDALGGLDDRPALARAAAEAGVPLVTAAVAGASGWVATVLPGAPGPADLFGSGPAAEDVLGSPAPSVAVAANLQCAEALRILGGRAPALAGALLVFDLDDMTFETVRLD